MMYSPRAAPLVNKSHIPSLPQNNPYIEISIYAFPLNKNVTSAGNQFFFREFLSGKFYPPNEKCNQARNGCGRGELNTLYN